MSNTTETYTIKLNSSQFDSKLDQTESKMNNFESKLGGVGKMAAGVFGGGLMLSAFNNSIGLIKDTAFEVIKLGTDFEQTRISFETMLGSADIAAETLDKLKDFASTTPFQFGEVLTASKQLLGFSFEADSLTKNLTMLGDVSAGLSIPLGDLVYLYGTIKNQGKANLVDLKQFANRGIPIYKELAKVTKYSASQLTEGGKDVDVYFSDVEKAFKNMTAKGSMFGGLMEKLSKSFSGRWSNFIDKLENKGRELGTMLLPYLNKALDTLDSMVDSFLNVDFREWTEPLMQIWDSLKGIYKTLDDVFDFDALGGQFLNGLRQLVKDVLFMSNTLVATMEYVAGRAAAAGSSRSGPTLSSDEYKEWRKTHSEDEALPTFESALKDKLQKAADTWSGKFELSTQSKSEKEGLSKSKEGLQKSLLSEKPTAKSSSDKASKESSIGIERVSSSTRNINISINELVHEITFSKTNSWRENESELVEKIKRALLTAVNDVNIVAQ